MLKTSLLEELAKECGCMYLSDLPRLEHFSIMLPVIPHLSGFSCREWSDAATYIFGEPVSFDREESAKSFFYQTIRYRSKLPQR